MPKLPNDNISAYESVQDTLSAATTVCVSILNAEESKEIPNQCIIDKYEQILDDIFDLKHELSLENPKRMQEISDKYISFVRSHRDL